MKEDLFLERILFFRTEKGYTQEYLASILHVTQRTYSYYEKGRRKMPIDLIANLARLYDVSIDYLLGISDDLTNSLVFA